jgi:hypothetical protein
MYMRALQGYEEALGPNHTSTLNAVHCLAILRKDQGKLGEAEKMYMRALQGYDEALGPKHTSTLITVYNLLTLSENDNVVYFVHQSAKDYLTSDPNLDSPHSSTPRASDSPGP